MWPLLFKTFLRLTCHAILTLTNLIATSFWTTLFFFNNIRRLATICTLDSIKLSDSSHCGLQILLGTLWTVMSKSPKKEHYALCGKEKRPQKHREIQLSTSQCSNKPHFSQGHASKQSGCQSNWCTETLRGYEKTNRDTESSSEVDPAGPGRCGIMNTHWSTDTSPLQSFIPTFQFSSPGGGTIHSWNTARTWQRVHLGSKPRISHLSSSSNAPRLSSHSL